MGECHIAIQSMKYNFRESRENTKEDRVNTTVIKDPALMIY